MITKYFSNPKKKDQPSKEVTQILSFDELCPPIERKLEKEFWKYSHEELHKLFKEYDTYIDNLRNGYEGMMSYFQSLVIKSEQVDTMRKTHAEEKEKQQNYIIELEQTLEQLQHDYEQEQQDHEETKLKFLETTKQLEQLQSEDKEHDSNSHSKHESTYFDDPSILNITKDFEKQQQQQSLELQLQKRKVKELDSYVKSLLSQIVDVQSKYRNETENNKKLIAELTLMVDSLSKELESQKSQRITKFQMEVDINDQELKIRELNEQNQDSARQLNAHQIIIGELQQKINAQENLIKLLRQKREAAIIEITQLSSQLQSQNNKLNSSPVKDSKIDVRGLKIDIMNALLAQRKKFDSLYKLFLDQIFQSQEQYSRQASQFLLKFERDLSSMSISIQDLMDEIDDLIRF